MSDPGRCGVTDEPTVSGFTWEEGNRLMRLVIKNRNGEAIESWEPCLPFNVIPVRALREGEDIKVVEATVRFASGREKHVVLPASIISAGNPSLVVEQQTGLDLSRSDAKALADFLEVIVNEASTVPVEDVLTTAEWRADDLVTPGTHRVSPRKAYAELAKYGAVRGDEDAARDAWRDVLKLAAHPGNEKLLLILGMPLGSVYAARLRRAPFDLPTSTFALHLSGDSGLGKTQAAIAAMMTVGDAREKATTANLYRTWDMSAQAPVALAHQLGVLPIFLDEAATSQRTSEEFTQAIFALAQGSERQRATTAGDLDDVERWECCVLSTGEMRLSAKSGLVGIRRRVQELSAPFAPRAHADTVLRLATEHCGWPLRWLSARPNVDDAARLFRDVEHGFEDEISWLNAAAANLSVCGLGALMLARELDLEEVTVSIVHKAVQETVDDLGRSAIDEGADAGIKLLRSVWAAVAKRPLQYPDEDETFATGAREGVRFKDGTVGVIDGDTLQKLATEAGLPDYQAALDKLKAVDLVVHEEGRNTVRKALNLPGDVVRKRIFVFKPVPNRDE